MQDLNTIRRLNNERCGDQVATARATGKHVLVYKTGLHVTHVKEYDTAEEVRAATRDEELPYGVTREYLAPTTKSHSLVRDQSEDRTLADYIARKH